MVNDFIQMSDAELLIQVLDEVWHELHLGLLCSSHSY